MRVRAVRWANDEPFPGLVEVELIDVDDRQWTFIDKSAIFDRDGVLGPSAPYPISLTFARTVLERGDDRVVISTANPSAVESVEHESRFVVRPDQLADADT